MQTIVNPYFLSFILFAFIKTVSFNEFYQHLMFTPTSSFASCIGRRYFIRILQYKYTHLKFRINEIAQRRNQSL